MRFELAQLAASWPLAVSLAAVATGSVRAGRRRTAMNEALHELRRPLQTLALSTGQHEAVAGGAEGSLWLMAAAVERLDREINGAAAPVRTPAPVAVWPLAADAVRRWGPAAASAGASLELCWGAGDAEVDGVRCELAQALDNLIANAIEHGGAAITVEVERGAEGLRLAVVDSGRPGRRDSRRRGLAERLVGLSGRRRHGHGLRVAQRVAEAHGGSFQMRRRGRGTEAVLELPFRGTGWVAA